MIKQIGVPQYGGLILLISHMSPLSTITVIILTIDWVGGGDGEGDRRYKAMPSYILAPGGWERVLKTKITYEVVENAFHSTLPEASETVR